MPRRIKIYVSSIGRQWAQMVPDNPDEAIVLSPYLTSRTAEAVIQNANHRNCMIYTLFTAENFALGSSSLATVKNLVTKGYRVHHVPGLHAKVVLTKDAFTIGSQNLTAQGTRNIEVSAAVLDEARARKLRSEIDRLIAGAMLITADHLAVIEPLVKSLRREYRVFEGKIAAAQTRVNNELAALQHAREERLAAEQGDALRRKSFPLRRALERARRSMSVVPVSLVSAEYDNTLNGRGFSSGYYAALKAERGATLLRWNMEGDDVEFLRKTNRYLFVHRDTGRLAWAAVFATQISKVAREVSMETDSLLPGLETKIECELLWEPADLKSANIRIKLTAARIDLKRQMEGYFSINKLSITKVNDQSSNAWKDRLSKLGTPETGSIRDLLADRKNLGEALRLKLLEPFKFEWNSQTLGVRSFLKGARSNHFNLSLFKMNGDPIFEISER